MRIIAGIARGRRLLAPKGLGTRPTPDRVREALFSILADRVEGARVLDLFAGTGALGLEALSRGAAHATFVEKDRAAIAPLRKNIDSFAEDSSRLLTLPVHRALTLLASEGACFDLVFADPPYDAGLLDETVRDLARRCLLAPGALVCCEHRPGEPPAASHGYGEAQTRTWGDVAMTLLEGNTE